MLKTILVPVDGSPLSERALPFAQGIARRTGARLLVMRAVLMAKPSVPEAEHFNEAAVGEAEAELAEITARATEAGAAVESFVWDDEAGWAIVGACDAERADLIVMCTHGRSGLGRVMYGSVADHVLRTARVPVLLVPPAARYRFAPPFKILVPLDGLPLAEEALAPALDFAETLQGEVILVRAIEPPTHWVVGYPYPYAIDDPPAELEAARRYLDAAGDRHRRQGVQISGFVVKGPAAEVITEAARDHRAGAIAMATHGRGGLARMLLGSVTQQVLRATPVPLLLVRPGAARQHVHIARQVEAGSEASEVAVLMTPEEIELNRLGLERLLETADEDTAERVRALHDRLDEALQGRLAPAGLGEGQRR